MSTDAGTVSRRTPVATDGSLSALRIFLLESDVRILARTCDGGAGCGMPEWAMLSVMRTGQPRMSMADAVDRAAHLAESSDFRLLGLVGPPGVGKSTLSALLAERIGAAMVVVGMDGFHLANAELGAAGPA